MCHFNIIGLLKMSVDHGKYKLSQRNALMKRGFTISKRIGEGGFGMILLARSARYHGRMAIKVIGNSSDGMVDPDLQWSIDNEKLFADLFDHPYISAYHEIIETSKR